ncbi:hypothetical protein ACOMHN_062455 [Nucella lapillus]
MTARKLIGRPVPDLETLFEAKAIRRLKAIQQDPSHPLCDTVLAQVSARSSRLVSFRARTDRITIFYITLILILHVIVINTIQYIISISIFYITLILILHVIVINTIQYIISISIFNITLILILHVIVINTIQYIISISIFNITLILILHVIVINTIQYIISISIFYITPILLLHVIVIKMSITLDTSIIIVIVFGCVNHIRQPFINQNNEMVRTKVLHYLRNKCCGPHICTFSFLLL